MSCIDIADRGSSGAKHPCYFSMGIFSGYKQLLYSAYLVFRQLCIASTCIISIQNIATVSNIFGVSHALQIFWAIVVANPIFMIYFMIIWYWSKKRFENNSMDQWMGCPKEKEKANFNVTIFGFRRFKISLLSDKTLGIHTGYRSNSTKTRYLIVREWAKNCFPNFHAQHSNRQLAR